MSEGLEALTKLVKIVMAYRPDTAKKARPRPAAPQKPKDAR